MDQCILFSFTSDTNITEKNAFQALNLLKSRCGRELKKFEVWMDSEILCQALIPTHAALAVTTCATIGL